jgi:hypothetical protein
MPVAHRFDRWASSQDAAVQFAFQLLKKAEDLVLASYDQYDHVFATFGELQQRLAELPSSTMNSCASFCR